MSKIWKIARRTFLFGSAAVIGGVAFGYYMYKRPAKNPLLESLQEGEAALTPYVKIDKSGVTLITPRADKGQGAYSVQAALIAEEMDINLDQVEVSPGTPSPAYYNTALAHDAVPFRPTDESFAANTMRGVADAAIKFMGMQITGGSSTVPDGYEKLRVAGAVARETLKAAASEMFNVPIDKLSTERGTVILPDGRTIDYTALAEKAAEVDLVTDVTLRDPSTWRLLGKPMERLDIPAKSTGKQRYGIDFEIEGTVHAAVRLNPRQSGALVDYNASDALGMPGVLGVYPVTGGVAVVADNTWRAFQAAEAVRCEWGPTVFPATMEEHWQTLSDSFTQERQDSQNRDDGDVEAALEQGEVIEAEYRAPYLAHAPLEPINATVLVSEARVDVWTGTQLPRFVQKNVADITGFEIENVYVHGLMMGGSFGHRLEDDVVRQAAQVALELKGTPVKLTYRREEDMRHDYVRQIAMARMRGAVERKAVKAYDLSIAMPSVVASQMGRQNMSIPGPDAMIVAGAWEQPFDIEHYRVTGYRAPELAPISSWRSVGASSNAFFHEGFLDEMIVAAGADPLEERLRLCSHEASRKVLETVGYMSQWGKKMGPNQGRGLAFCLSFGVPVAEVIDVTATTGGIKIDNVYVAADVGKIVDPVNFESHVKGGVIWALGHAMNCEITYSDGIADQDNFYAFEGMRMAQCPKIDVRGLENGVRVRGIGEPLVPPAAPALAAAIFRTTGTRLREMPFNKVVDFV